MIRASAGAGIDRLVADLSSERAPDREAAIARLTILGAPAVGRVLSVLTDTAAPGRARTAALRALEGATDNRILQAALGAVGDPDVDVAVAAIDVARGYLRGDRGVAAVDRLTIVALDKSARVAVRVAAIRALQDLRPATLKPLLAALRSDPAQEIAAAVAGGRSSTAHQPNAIESLNASAGGVLPDDAAMLRAAVVLAGDQVELATLQQIIDRIGDRERATAPRDRSPWTTARGAAHLALARRNSRLALYDLRDTIGASEAPLPVEFLAAVTAIGDRTCLEPLAAAYARSPAAVRARADWWHRHLIDAFRGIVRRERITRRHATVKKIEKRWPVPFGELWER